MGAHNDQDIHRRTHRAVRRARRLRASRTATRHPHRPARSGVSLAEGRAAVRAAHGQVADTLPIINGLAVRLPAGARARLAHDARIAAISANASIRRRATASTPPSSRRPTRRRCWPRPSGTARPARPARVSASRSSTRASTAACADFSDAQGTSRVVASVVTNPDATTPNDDYGHGTHVAGIIAGDSTRRPAGDPLAGRYVGIAPDANLIAIKASDDEGDGTILDAIYGLQFAVDHKDGLQHPRRQPVGVLDGRRVLPDRSAGRRRRVRVLPWHRRRHRRRQPRQRRRRGRTTRRPTTRS